MAMEILVRVANRVDVLQGIYGNGHSVVARPSGFAWGALECPPDFVRIVVSDANTSADIDKMLAQWRREITYTILSDDPASDTFRVNIFADPAVSTTNPVAQITAQEMQNFLTGWGATDISAATDISGVTFQITAFDAIKSKGLFTFGDTEDAFMKYTSQAYEPTTGIHTVQLDYSLSSLKKENIQQTMAHAPAITVASIDDVKALCIFTADRADMISALKRQVADKFNKMLTRVRYRFSDNAITSALANNGVLTLTLADITANIIDVSTEV